MMKSMNWRINKMKTAIDWNESPKGATHYDVDADCFCKESGYWHDNNQMRYVDDDTQVGWGDEDRYLPKPITQPTFTQAMADAGELPSVGMECIYIKEAEHTSVFSDAIGRKVKVICHHNNMALIHWAGSYESFSHRAFKPIDTRTDKEKACDAIWKELDDNGKEYDLRTAMELAYDKWVGE